VSRTACTTLYPPAALAARLERQLGDPEDPGRALSSPRCLELDELEAFPADACAELDAFGVCHYDIPAEHGGAMRSREEPAALLRVLARRDVMLAVTYSSKALGAESVWVGGTPEQGAWVAGEVLAGARVALGVTERDHGGDLLGTEVSAVADGDGYRVDGEKWLINGATRGRLMCLLARTDPAGGPAGMSLLLVDKATLPEDRYRCLPKIRLHGMRGADVSGIRFDGARVPATALVGRAGAGLDIVLKALQLSRIGCVPLSLGAADQALRLAHRFAAGQRIGGRPLLDVPAIRAVLGRSYASLFVAEVVALVANRSIHALTGELSVVSAVAKSLIPTLVEDSIRALAGILGPHAYRRDGYAGRFQKMERDHRIVGIFEGSTFANRNALVNQFERLARSYRRGRADDAGVATVSRLDAPLPGFQPRGLSLVSRNGCSLVQSLPQAAGRVQDLARAGRVPVRLAELAEACAADADDLHAQLRSTMWAQRDLSPEAFALAERYERCFAAAACLFVWLDNHRRVPDGAATVSWRDGRWLAACLAMLLEPATGPAGTELAGIELVEEVDGAGHDEPASVLPRWLLEESDAD
jgi:alkylation response protein AidB-like acyl-CoA dehydrogenase